MADKSYVLMQRVKDHIARAEKLADDSGEAHRIRGWFAEDDQLTHELLELYWAGQVTPEEAFPLTRRLGRARRRVERGPVWTRLEQIVVDRPAPRELPDTAAAAGALLARFRKQPGLRAGDRRGRVM